MSAQRRGWRELVEPGIRRVHRVRCVASAEQQPGRRCSCPYSIIVPGFRPHATRTITVDGTLTEARAERRRLMAAGVARPPEEIVSASTIHAIATEWFAVGERRWSPGTFTLRERSYRLRVFPEFGTAPVESIARRAVEGWAARLIAQGHGRRAVQVAVETLRAVLTAAIERGLIDGNPASAVRLPPAPPPERTASDRVLDRDGKVRLLAVCTTLVNEGIVRCALEGGLRRGEICGLTWPDVHLPERRLVIRQSVHQDSRVGLVVKQAKTGGVARVAISEAFAAVLGAWYEEAIIAGGGDASSFVFPGRRPGAPMSPSSVSHLIGRLGKAAGLVDAKGRHVAHLHGLRHTAGSLALAEGVPLPIVSRQLRHGRPDFTARVYSHVLNDAELDRFAEAHGGQQDHVDGEPTP